MKNITFKSIHNKNIKVGDKVCLLVKVYGFSGIDRAHLRDCIYLGKGQWGYEFKDLHTQHKTIWRFREPEAVLL